MFQVAMCGSVNGDALNYGKLDPYLNEVVMHEHCYIRGPTGCQGDAVQLYTKIGMYLARPARPSCAFSEPCSL